MREVLREAVLKQKRGLQTAQRAIEGHIGIESIGGDAAIPPRVEILLEKEAVAGANYIFLVQGVRQTQARTKALMETFFRVPVAIAGIAPLLSGERQPSGSAAGSWVRANRVEKRSPIFFLYRWFKHIPTQTERKAQLARRLPVIGNEPAKRVALWFPIGQSIECCAGGGHVTQKKAGHRIPAGDSEKTRIQIREEKAPRAIGFGMGWILNIAVFAAKMQRMLSAHPGQRVVEDPGRPPGVKVSRASIAVIFAETDARSVRVIVDAG